MKSTKKTGRAHAVSDVGPPTVGLVSLGCAKNLADSEIILGTLSEAGYKTTHEATDADVLIVNTCSFIGAAKEESIEAIFEANRARGMRRRDKEQKLIVAGCLAQRFRKELPDAMPEVDGFMGLDQVPQVAEIVAGVWAGEGCKNYTTPRARYLPAWDSPRVRLTPPHYAYLKIAEGCNHPCAFCVIPRIRGGHRSRTVDSVLKEAENLIGNGVKEILLISQDTTYYGRDLSDERATLPELLRGLDKVGGDFWVRVLYTHPAHWSDELVEALAESKRAVKYVDMPLQHIDDWVLSKMRRETTEKKIRELLKKIRAGIPSVAVRTAFIAGFPGETPARFDRLMAFIEEAKFERLGIFSYSKEEGTQAYSMPGHVSARVKQSRFERAMELQQRIAAEVQRSRIGMRLRVLWDAPGVGRTEWDAPGVDGRVYGRGLEKAGTFSVATIEGSTDYDLIAKGGAIPKEDF